MKKAKIYIPTKTAMQSGRGKLNKISYTFIENKKKEFVIKSYADNFLKD